MNTLSLNSLKEINEEKLQNKNGVVLKHNELDTYIDKLWVKFEAPKPGPRRISIIA